MVFKLSSLTQAPVSLRGRLLPGAAMYNGSIEEFNRAALAAGVPEELRARAVGRLGSLVRYLLQDKNSLEPIGNIVLRGEVDLALKLEQAETLDDLMRRRLELEYLPGHGMSALAEIVSVLKEKSSASVQVESLERAYVERIQRLEILLKSPAESRTFHCGGVK